MDFEDIQGFEDDIGLGDEDKDKVKSNKIDWYKGEKGRTDRVAIVYFHRHDVKTLLKAKRQNPNVTPDQLKELAEKVKGSLCSKLGKQELSDIDYLDLSEVRFRTFSVHYQEGNGLGYLISKLGKGTADDDKVWGKLPEPRTYITTLLLTYRTDKDGDIDKEALTRAAKGEGFGTCWNLRPWKFSGDDKYKRIRSLNKGLVENSLSISGQDMKIECKETKFQQMDINLAGPALWQKAEPFKRAVLTKAVEMYDKILPAREMSTEELRVKLGMSSGGGGSSGSDTEDFSALLDQV